MLHQGLGGSQPVEVDVELMSGEEADLKIHARLCAIRYKLMYRRLNRIEKLIWLIFTYIVIMSFGTDKNDLLAILKQLIGI